MLNYIPKLFILLSVIDMLTNYSVANQMYYGPVGLTLLNKHYYYYLLLLIPRWPDIGVS